MDEPITKDTLITCYLLENGAASSVIGAVALRDRYRLWSKLYARLADSG
jgi:hypothetical protein